MRKMFLLFGMLATVGFLFVACTDEQATGPDEAAFGKKAVNCDLEEQTQLAADIRTGIGTLFNGKKNAKAATEMFNNVERKVCKGLLADATNTAYDFYVMTFRQLPDKLSGDEVAAAALVDMVFAFAAGLTEPGSTIPPEAMLPTGGLGVFDPVQGLPSLF